MVQLTHLALALAAIAPAFGQTLKPLTFVGCFSSPGSLSGAFNYTYQSTGYCQKQCVTNDNSAYIGLTNGNTCLCGSSAPPSSDQVSDSECDSPCAGYGSTTCGGIGVYGVFLTNSATGSGSGSGSSSSGTSGSSSGSSTTTGGSQVVTSIAPGQTVVVTESPVASSGSNASVSKTSHTNTGAIAAGVVVGVLAIAAIIGGLIFFMRQRKRRALEEEHRRHQVSDFMAGSRPAIPAVPGISRSPSGPDSRFDAEAMAHRRLSDGSIADNEDFSRRILKVTNPDDRA